MSFAIFITFELPRIKKESLGACYCGPSKNSLGSWTHCSRSSLLTPIPSEFRCFISVLVFRCHPYQTLTLSLLHFFSFFNGPLLNRCPIAPSLPRNIAQTPNVCHSKSDFKPNINQNLDKNLAKFFLARVNFILSKKIQKKEEEKTEQHKTKHRKILSYTLITCSLIGKGLISYSVGIGTPKRILFETIDATPKKGTPPAGHEQQ